MRLEKKSLKPHPQSKATSSSGWTLASLLQPPARCGACSGSCWSAWFLQFQCDSAQPGNSWLRLASICPHAVDIFALCSPILPR